MPKKSRPSVENLLASASHSTRCKTCQLDPEIREDAEKAYRLKEQDFPYMTWEVFERDVLQAIGYPYKLCALKRHIRNCNASKNQS